MPTQPARAISMFWRLLVYAGAFALGVCALFERPPAPVTPQRMVQAADRPRRWHLAIRNPGRSNLRAHAHRRVAVSGGLDSAVHGCGSSTAQRLGTFAASLAFMLWQFGEPGFELR